MSFDWILFGCHTSYSAWCLAHDRFDNFIQLFIILQSFDISKQIDFLIFILLLFAFYRDSHLIFSIDPKGCEDVDDTLSIRYWPVLFIYLS